MDIMSGFSSIVPTALSLAGSAAQFDQSASTAQAKADQVDRENQIIEAERQQQETERRNLLARQLATQRARMASFGVGLDGGSADAILDGLSQRSASDLAALNQTAALRTARNQASLLDDDDSSTSAPLMLANSGLKIFSSFYGANGSG
jgi:hypothetical protein